MTVKRVTTINRYIGAAADAKPTGVPAGSTFHEQDTDTSYVTYDDGTNWVVEASGGGGGGGGGDASAANQTTLNTLTGAVTEAAPANDTASSGLNGRLKRIAQNVTSLLTGIVLASGNNLIGSFRLRDPDDTKYVGSLANPLYSVGAPLSPSTDAARIFQTFTSGGWAGDGGTPLVLQRSTLNFVGNGAAQTFLAAVAGKNLVIWWNGDFGGHASDLVFADTAGAPVEQMRLAGDTARKPLPQFGSGFPTFVLGLGLGLTCNANAGNSVKGALCWAAI